MSSSVSSSHTIKLLSDQGAMRIEQELRSIGADAIGVRADVGVQADTERLVERALERFGRVDILVNNAGIYSVGPIVAPWGCSDAEWDRLLAVNLHGVFWLTRAVIKGMIERREGSIVNVTSLAAQAVRPLRSSPV